MLCLCDIYLLTHININRRIMYENKWLWFDGPGNSVHDIMTSHSLLCSIGCSLCDCCCHQNGNGARCESIASCGSKTYANVLSYQMGNAYICIVQYRCPPVALSPGNCHTFVDAVAAAAAADWLRLRKSEVKRKRKKKYIDKIPKKQQNKKKNF